MLITLLIFLPLLIGAIVWLLKSNYSKEIALFGALVEFGLGAYLFSKFVPNATSQFSVDYLWIKSANIHFSVGIDGISILMVLLSVLLVPFIIYSTWDKKHDNEPLFYGLILMMQTALIGVFCAKDAFLFYFFFEIALIPIYFIAAIWGGTNRIKVTFKFFIYTIFA